MNALSTSLMFFGLILVELTALFLGISTVVALVFEYLPENKLERWLQHRGLLGNCLGALLGAVTPFCSCSTIPMTVGLLRAGAPFGATMSFVLASPLLNPIILGMLLVLTSPHAALTYGVVTFVMSVVAGVVVERLGLSVDVKNVRVTGEQVERPRLTRFRDRLRRAFTDAWSDFRGILVFMLVGVAIGAVIYGYVPDDFVVRLAGPQNPLAIPVAAIIGVPLYIRAETVIPIGLALTSKGMSLGAVIALIIGGAGMSIPEMSMLAGIFRVRLVAVFVAAVFVTAVCAGLLFNLL